MPCACANIITCIFLLDFLHSSALKEHYRWATASDRRYCDEQLFILLQSVQYSIILCCYHIITSTSLVLPVFESKVNPPLHHLTFDFHARRTLERRVAIPCLQVPSELIQRNISRNQQPPFKIRGPFGGSIMPERCMSTLLQSTARSNISTSGLIPVRAYAAPSSSTTFFSFVGSCEAIQNISKILTLKTRATLRSTWQPPMA